MFRQSVTERRVDGGDRRAIAALVAELPRCYPPVSHDRG
jgi:hypothetical protein